MLNFKKSELCMMLMSTLAIQASAKDVQPTLLDQDTNVGHLVAQNHLIKEKEDLIARNNTFTTFNSSSLFGNQRDVDLSSFTSKNFVPSGSYLVQLSVNQEIFQNVNVTFDQLDSQKTAVLCLDNNFLNLIDFKKEFRNNLPIKKCLTIKEIDSDAFYDFDVSELKLDLSIPQSLLVDRPQGYVNPKLFSNGINSGFIGYAFNYNRDDDRESKYLGLNSGLNFAGWFFRHAGAFESKDSGLGDYYSDQNVLYKDITHINSRLSLGQFNTNTYKLDNLPIVGLQVASDQDMLPWSYRQYAPVIQNFAYTNAVVRIYQNGQKLYEKTVPRGTFEINDLNAGNGDLTVEITETGGEKRTFTVPLQSNQDLVRKGRYNYSLAAGQYRPRKESTDDQVYQGSFNYGLTNNITFGAGLNFSDDYYSGLTVIAMNTLLGGLTTTIEHTDAELFGKKYQGEKYSLNYRYSWIPQNLYFYADYASYDRDYISLSSHLYQRNESILSDSEIDNFLYNYNLKQNFGFSLSKAFNNSKLGNISLSVRKNNYWEDSDNYYQYNFSYGNSWNHITYNIGYSRTDYSNHIHERGDSAYLSVSIPLNWRENKMYANASVQRDQNDQTISNVNLSGVLGKNNEMNFGLGASNTERSTLFNGNLSYLSPIANLGTTVSFDSEQNSQYSLSAQGAFVAHRYGITSVNNLSDTFTIIHAKDGEGANVANAWGIKVDRFGNAIYPYNSPYSKNTITLDPQNLASNVTLESNQTDVIPRRYSSQLAEFKVNKSSNILLRIRNLQIQPLLMGSQLKDGQGNVLGIVDASNQVIVDKQDALLSSTHIVWGAEEHTSCSIEPISQKQLDSINIGNFNIIDVECK